MSETKRENGWLAAQIAETRELLASATHDRDAVGIIQWRARLHELRQQRLGSVVHITEREEEPEPSDYDRGFSDGWHAAFAEVRRMLEPREERR